jgi:hypothetical protein
MRLRQLITTVDFRIARQPLRTAHRQLRQTHRFLTNNGAPRRIMTQKVQMWSPRSSEATIGIPSWKLGAEHTSDRSNCDRNIAGRINRTLVNADVPAPEIDKALTFAIHMRRTRGVIKFVKRELT